MTIQEAIKSGKPFKRENEEYNDRWFYISPSGVMRSEHNGSMTPVGGVSLNAKDILADDWVVSATLKDEPPTIAAERKKP